MPIVVGAVLRKTKDKIYATTGRFDLKLNDKIILETDYGVEVGMVCQKEQDVQIGKSPIGKVLRKITEEDGRRLAENEKRNLAAYEVVMQSAKNHGLDMDLICVWHTFDRLRLFVYYTSQTRVDFRELIKDLGHILKTKIQMVQIGARDEAKMIGGIGVCGQILCCQRFLKNFCLVTMDMVKNQELSLTASKLSGLCGKLTCCISYENDTYASVKKNLPDIGAKILTPEGEAKLAAIDCIREKVTVDFGGLFKTFTIKQIKETQ
jgi:cell fate regulator YaaT (PSP1 superfamily)